MTCPAVVRLTVPAAPAVVRVVTPGPPGSPGAPGQDGSDADVTAHEAAADPHPQYTTTAEAIGLAAGLAIALG